MIYEPSTKWIRWTDKVILNINFISKVLLDTTTFRVMVYHGISATTGSTGGQQTITYSDLPTATAAYDKLVSAIGELADVKDIR